MLKIGKKRIILWVYEETFDKLKSFKEAKEKELNLTKLTWNDTINLLIESSNDKKDNPVK